MNKGQIIRASLVMGTFLIIILIAVSCEAIFNKDQVYSNISNGENVYMTIGSDVTVTNQELWDYMKAAEGMTYLEEYVDRMLLADYIDQIQPEDVENEILLLKYYTTDPDIIAEIQANEEVHQQYLDSFNENIKLLGFDPEVQEDLEAFMQLGIAKRLYAKSTVLNAVDGDDFYIDDEMLQQYYESDNKGTACTIEVRFNNSVEAKEVFDHFNLVASYTNEDGETGIGLYDPALNEDKDISTVAKSQFNDTNTVLLSENQVFSYYIKLWNYMNPYTTPINEGEVQLSYCTNYADMAWKDYSEMVDQRSTNDPYVKYANFVFNTMDITVNGAKKYTYSHSNTYGDFMVMTFKLSQVDAPEFSTLSDQDKLDLRVEIADQLANDTVIKALMLELRQERNLTIYDPHFRLQLEYRVRTGQTTSEYVLNDDGNKDYLASFESADGTKIWVSPDDLFGYMIERVGVQYSIELAKIEVLLHSMYYEDLFGTSKDVLTSKNDNVVQIRDIDLENIQDSFLNGVFAQQYGFDPSIYDWSEFVFLAFNVYDIESLIRDVYMVDDIKPLFRLDAINYEDAVAHMQDQIDRYLSVEADHLLIYVDRDGDFGPDDYSDFKDGLTPEQVIEYDALFVALENAITTELAQDGATFTKLVLEYRNADPYGDSVWAQFKQYGFVLKTEALGELSHNNLDGLDEAFGNEVIRLYNLYQNSEFIDGTELLSDQLIESDFGIHLVEITKTDTFLRPSAEFSYDDVEDPVGTYADGVENDSVLPNQAQVEAWLQIKRDVASGANPSVTLPESVEDAVSYYFGPIYNVYANPQGTGLGIIIAQYMIDNNVTYTSDNAADLVAQLEMMLDTYYQVSFPELFAENVE